MQPSLREAILSRTFFRDEARSGLKTLCALMDADLGSGVVTLAAFADGTVSLYNARGGGMIDLGKEPAVRTAAARFIEEAGHARGAFQAATELLMPADGQVTFYVVAPEATCTSGPIRPEAMRSSEHPLHTLFAIVNRTLTGIRLSQKK